MLLPLLLNLQWMLGAPNRDGGSGANAAVRRAIEARRRRVALAHEQALAEQALLDLQEEQASVVERGKEQRRELKAEFKRESGLVEAAQARKLAEREYLRLVAESRRYVERQKELVVRKQKQEREKLRVLKAEQQALEVELAEARVTLVKRRRRQEFEIMGLLH
tara:strand:- start:443 stop:934 length:492 start_codon:yes stop_codon:yes gene_type:complete